jgi:Protein of unknown function (DUF3102)
MTASAEAPTTDIDLSIPLAGRELVPFVSLEERAVSIRKNYMASLNAELDASMYRQNAGHELMAVKALLAHGDWLPWLKANFRFTAREAQRLIRCAEESTIDGRQRLEAESAARRERAKSKCDSPVVFEQPPAPAPEPIKPAVERVSAPVNAKAEPVEKVDSTEQRVATRDKYKGAIAEAVRAAIQNDEETSVMIDRALYNLGLISDAEIAWRARHKKDGAGLLDVVKPALDVMPDSVLREFSSALTAYMIDRPEPLAAAA